MIPFKRNRFFTGRENEIQKMYKSLHESTNSEYKIHVISGSGGIGKTQIVLEYTFRNSVKYDYIFWINAESETTLNSSL